MKKTFVTTFLSLVLAALLLIACSQQIVFAEPISDNECNRVFYETVNKLFVENDGETITAKKSLLYNIDLEPSAMLYEFHVGEKHGFCVIGSDNGKYIPFEIYPEGISPYLNAIGLPIYVAQTIYADYREDGLYYIDGIGVTKEAILQELAPYYGIDYGLDVVSSEISYVTKTINEHVNAKRIPAYCETSGANACAAVAGANLIAYFDRFATELLPNYTPGVAIGQNYMYKVQNETINDLVSALYVGMGINGIGATSLQFMGGLNMYCNLRGYGVDYQDVLAGGSINYSAAKNALAEGKALVLFESRFSVSTITESGNNDLYQTMSGTVNHVMAAFGYREITYKFTDGSSSTKRFFVTATGMHGMPNGYLNVDMNLGLNEAYAIDIA